MSSSQRGAAYHQCGRELVRERTDTGVLTRENQSARDGCGCPELVALSRERLEERKERDPGRPSRVSEAWYKRKKGEGKLAQGRAGVVDVWPVESTHAPPRPPSLSHP